MVNLHQLLKVMVEKGASDLHIATGSPPQLRIDGKLIPLKMDRVSPADTKMLCYSVLTDAQKKKYEEESELDFSFGVKGLSRFRGNIFVQRGAVGGAFRTIPYEVMSFDDLGLPGIANEICKKPRGLVLVTGPTGSGKSTTLASMIDKINTDTHEHIMTIEDPIEFLHQHKNCLVNQREVNSDTKSFTNALKYILRQDPDVVLIGEMRDLETIEAALRIAETGHLVFATLHTNTAVQTMNRIIDVFPPHQQGQVRAQLSFVLEAVMTQILIPRASGTGRVLCMEILIPNAAIRNLIREDKVHQLYSQMLMGQSKHGMTTMNQSLLSLYQSGDITLEDALSRTPDPDEFNQMVSKLMAQKKDGKGPRPPQQPTLQ